MAKRDYRGRAASNFQTNLWQKSLIIFMALFLILAVQKIAEKEENKNEGMVAPSGNIMAEIHWPDKLCVDVDLWVQSPDDERPVGWSNRGGKTFNLVRDDLGCSGDTTDRNYEIAAGRGLPAGEYTVNIQLYANPESAQDISVDVMITAASKDGARMEQIIPPRNIILRQTGEEITVVRFTIDKNGELDPSSVHNIYKGLAAAVVSSSGNGR